MSEHPRIPTQEEVERTYYMVRGMASRKLFISEQDREDFVQEVMKNACSSYNPNLERSLSFKNFACGPVFKRTYQSYWKQYYSRKGREFSWSATEPVIEEAYSGRHDEQVNPVRDDRTRSVHGVLLFPGDHEDSYTEDHESCLGNLDHTHTPSFDPVRFIIVTIIGEEIDLLGHPYSELIRCFLMGMTREQAAVRLGKSTSWAKKYTPTARAKLLERLRARGIEVDDNVLSDW